MIGSPLADTPSRYSRLPALSLGVSGKAWAAQLMTTENKQAEDEGVFHGAGSAASHGHCQQLQALGNGGGRGIRTDFAPAFAGHIAHDQLRGVLFGLGMI
jgi:hypothetical protein